MSSLDQKLVAIARAMRMCLVVVPLILIWPFAITAQAPGDEPGPEVEELFSSEELGDEDSLFGEEADDGEPALEETRGDPPADAPEQAGVDGAAEPDDGASTIQSQGVEEILIRGQAGRGVDVEAPASVTAFDASDLEALGVGDISDLSSYTPNLEIRTTGATTPTFFIRGVGLNDFTANGEGAIAIYQDDVVLSLPAIQLGQLFDVQDVVIERGPQGSGPARNASGGAIYVTSRQPTGESAGYLRTEVGRYSSLDVEGALEVPLIPDVLSTRLSFRREERDPFTRNGCATSLPIGLERVRQPNSVLQPPLCSENERTGVRNPAPSPEFPRANYFVSGIKPNLPSQVNDKDRWAARMLLRYQPPNTDLDVVLNMHGGRVDQLYTLGQAIGTGGANLDKEGNTILGYFGGDSRGYRAKEIGAQQSRIEEKVGFVPGLPFDEAQRLRAKAKRILSRKLAEQLDERPFFGDYNNPGRERVSTGGGSVSIDWQGKDVRIYNIAAVEAYDRYRSQDADFSSRVLFEARVKDRAWQVTEDLRISGELDAHPVQWEVGALLLAHEFDLDRRDDGGNNVVDIRVIANQFVLGGNVFARTVWDAMDDVTVEAGVRYNVERKRYDQQLFRASLVPRPDAIRPCKTLSPGQDKLDDCDADRLEHAPTGSLSVTFRPAEAVTAYWKYSRGWKSAQFSGGGAQSIFRAAKPESVDSFEIGGQLTLFNDRLSVRASAFHYTYSDYHVFVTRQDAGTPPVREVVNADDATLYGAEIEGELEPLEGFVIELRAGWIESEFKDFSLEAFKAIPNPPPEPPIPTLVQQDYTGNRLPNTPRFTFSGSAVYTLELGKFGALIPRWDFAWTDDIFFDQSNGRGNPNDENVLFMPDFAIGQPAYWLHNVRLAYRTPDGAIEVAGWVRNLLDERYKTLAFDASAAGFVGNIVGDPRTYGISVGLEW